MLTKTFDFSPPKTTYGGWFEFNKPEWLSRLYAAWFCLCGRGVVYKVKIGCPSDDKGEIDRNILAIVPNKGTRMLATDNELYSFCGYYIGNRYIYPK